MANKTLESLKAAFAKTENSQTRENLPNNYYPFWNMKEDEQCKVRFLPDANESNPFGFLVVKSFHTLEINGEKKSVPCLYDHFGEDCPICKISQNYYKVEGKESVNGKKFWKKKQYITQALIIEDPLPIDSKTNETHKGKLRYITLGYQLYNVIQEAFKSDEVLDSIPYNFEDGYDFIIKKTAQGKYGAYNIGSMFSRKQRSLSEDEMVVVNEHLADLSTLLPKHPGLEKVEAMLEAALTGANYKDEHNSFETVGEVKAATRTSKPQLPDDDSEPFETQTVVKPTPKTEEPEEGNSDVDNMLATIRARRAAQAKAS